MIITDGQSTGGINTLRDPIKKLKDDSVNIISIGVGNKANVHELKFMATSPTSTHVYSVQNMDQLKNLIGSITSSSCSSEFFFLSCPNFFSLFTHITALTLLILEVCR